MRFRVNSVNGDVAVLLLVDGDGEAIKGKLRIEYVSNRFGRLEVGHEFDVDVSPAAPVQPPIVFLDEVHKPSYEQGYADGAAAVIQAEIDDATMPPAIIGVPGLSRPEVAESPPGVSATLGGLGLDYTHAQDLEEARAEGLLGYTPVGKDEEPPLSENDQAGDPGAPDWHGTVEDDELAQAADREANREDG